MSCFKYDTRVIIDGGIIHGASSNNFKEKDVFVCVSDVDVEAGVYIKVTWTSLPPRHVLLLSYTVVGSVLFGRTCRAWGKK